MVVDGFGGYSHPTALRAVRILKRGWWIILLTTVAVAGAAYYQASRQAGAVHRLLAGPPQVPEPGERPHRDPGSLDRLPGSAAGRPDADADRDVTRRREPGRRGRQDSGADPRLVPRQRKRHCGDRCGHPELRHHLRRRRDGRKACDDPRRGVHPRTGESSTRRRSSPPARSSVDGSTELEQSGFKDSSPLVARLAENEQALRTMEALQTANASLLRPASGAAQIQPRTKRAVVLGVMLGLMLGHRARLRPRCPRHACCAPRRRSATSSGRRCSRGSPLRREKLRRKNRLVMIASPHSADAEAFRMLRANLEFVNLDRGARSIMVTSALEKEGKSTTVANLAVALARAGQKVALVDLDLRRPAIAKLLRDSVLPSGHDEHRRRVVDAGAGPRRGESYADGRGRRVSCRRKRRRLERQRWRPQGADVGPDSAQPRRARQGKAADGRARAARPRRSTSSSSTRLRCSRSATRWP